MSKEATKKPASKTLLEKALELGRPQSRRPNWVNELPAGDQEQLLELREAYRGGRLPGWRPKDVWELLLKPAGIDCGVTYETFRAWISDYYGQGKKTGE